MSFFGFDTNLPRDRQTAGTDKGIFEHTNPFAEVQKARKLRAFQDTEDEVIDFEDTYDGLGNELEEANDDFNDDTFGGGVEAGSIQQGQVGRDFDFFGRTAQVAGVLDQEQMRYNLQHPPQGAQQSMESAAPRPKKTGYERYQDPGFIPDIQAKSSVWGTKSHAPSQPKQDPEPPLISTARNNAAPSKKMMSLEEVEAAMRAQSQPMPMPPPETHQHGVVQPVRQPRGPSGLSFDFSNHRPIAHLSSDAAAPVQTPQVAEPQPAPVPVRQVRSEVTPPQPVPTKSPQQPLQILQNPNRPRHSPQSSLEKVRTSQAPQPAPPVTAPGALRSVPVITHPSQLMELSEEQRRAYLEEDARRAKRNHKIFLLSKGNGLMTPQDKNFITRIQLQQLVTATGNSADPSPEAALVEDFYYQVYSQIRGAPRQHPTQPLGHFAQTYLFQTGGRVGGNRRHNLNSDNHMQRMQQQVQRAVEAAKLKPKNKQLIIEGSLGKISFSNAKTPKPLLNIKRHESGDPRPATARKGTPAGVSPSDRKTVLKNIEAVYTILMQMEDHERVMPPPPVEGDLDAIQAHMTWRQEMHGFNSKLWQALKVLDPIVPGSLVTHPFIAFLSFAKGKKSIPRVFRHIDQEQRVTILTMIVVHLDQLDAIRSARVAPGETQPPPVIREEIELFSHAVMPSLLGYVSEAPINIMIGLLGLAIDHTNTVNVVKTKIGLGILTMLLSRAELVKETSKVSDDDWQQWTGLYNRFFDILEPVLDSLFPSPVNTGDDMYIWQFLAAVGIGASPEQQQRLVIGVKDRVMETVTQSRTLPPEMSSQRLANVNLFMRAIGLDVELLG